MEVKFIEVEKVKTFLFVEHFKKCYELQGVYLLLSGKQMISDVICNPSALTPIFQPHFT